MNDENSLGEPVPIVPREDIRPVFFVGMNGSGTTMLMDCMGRHPDLYDYPYETKLIPTLIASINKFGDLGLDKNFLRLWSHVCTSDAFSQENRRHPLSVPSNWMEFPRDLASVLDAVFRQFAAKEGKIRWCEKTPQHIQHIPSLHNLFPQAKFVHIIRDGRDCAASVNRRFKRTPEYSIYRWKNVIRKGQEQGALLDDKYLEVRYEDVTIKPEFWMTQICEFLGLPFSKNILLSRYPQRVQDSGRLGEVKGGLEPNSGKWRTYFSGRQLAKMEKIAGACLAEHNYLVQYNPGDSDPSRLKLIFWQWRDYGWEFLSLVSRNLNRQGKIRSSEIFRRIRIALQQSRTNRY